MKRFYAIAVTIGLMMAVVLFVSCKKKADVAQGTATAENGDAAKETEKQTAKPPTAKEVGEAYGLILARSVKASKLELDVEALKKAYLSAIKKEITQEDEQLAVLTINSAMQIAYQKRAEQNKKDGEAFLEKNAKKDGVTTLESGLQYEVLTDGTGVTPGTDWKCTLHYKGTLLDGTEFDNSYTHSGGEPVEVDMNLLIPGWQEGLTHMKVGGKYRLYVPYSLAYGENGVCGQGGEEIIPPNAALIFEIELIDAKAKEEQGKQSKQLSFDVELNGRQQFILKIKLAFAREKR